MSRDGGVDIKERDRSRIRRFVVPGVLVVVASIVALVIGELGLRQLPGSDRYYVLPPNIVRSFNPSPTVVPGVHGPNRFTTNSDGLRGRDFGERAQEYRILAIGGSTTECLLLDDLEAWPHLLERQLARTADGRRIWSGGAGRAGMTARDHAVQIKYLLRQHVVDAVLLLVGINDMGIALAGLDGDMRGRPVADPEAERRQIPRAFAMAPGRLHEPSEFLAASDAPWYKRTASYQLLKRTRMRVSGLLGRRGFVQNESGTVFETLRSYRRMAPRILSDSELPDLAPSLAEYRRNLVLIVERARAAQVRVILMTQPTLWRHDATPAEHALLWWGGVGNFMGGPGQPYYSIPAMMKALDMFNATLRNVCTTSGVECIDLAARVPKDPSIFYDDDHFTERGAAVVADVIVEYLRARSPFATLPPGPGRIARRPGP